MIFMSQIDMNSVEFVRNSYERLLDEVSKVIIGMEDVIEMVFIGLITRGHILLEGVPGIAKTTLAKTIAKCLNLNFSRIQFTPDLLPADIIGSYIFDQKSGKFYLRKGPIFANIILADEINRGNPKTQSALLEAMQERQVTIEGNTLKLPDPFIVIATQNPIEVEGTYPLPTAQLDRFLAKVIMNYPNYEDTIKVIKKYSSSFEVSVNPILSGDDIIKMYSIVYSVHIDESITRYIADIIETSRKIPEVKLGVSPRGAIALALASKAEALINGRDYVIPDDVKKVAPYILNHRIFLTPTAIFEGTTVQDVIDKILSSVKVPT